MDRLEFFTTLFPSTIDGYVGLRALPSKHEEFIRIGEWDALEHFVGSRMHQNLYFGVAVRRPDDTGWISLGRKHAAELTALFCDIDFKNTDEQTVRTQLRQCPKLPSIVINSGGGLHCYWLLETPIPADDRAKS